MIQTEEVIQPTQQEIQERPSSKQKSKKFKAPEYLREMNILDKIENHKIIRNMNKRINYLKNPRFAVNRNPLKYSDIEQKPGLQSQIGEKNFPFRPSSKVILFQDYMINQIYDIKLYLTNLDKISRRFKYLPPATPQFTVSDIVYPQKFESDSNKEYGLIAPGMNVALSIKFKATSFAEFEDSITIFGDENFIVIPIIARREPPSINLPEILDCQSSWLGDKVDMIYRVTNKGGEAGFKFFKEQENDDDYPNEHEQDILKLNNFTIYPVEFFIQKNETQEIFIQYYPSQEGVQFENVILACDNQTSATYKVLGRGNVAELCVYGLDDFVIDNHQENKDGLRKIFFQDVLPNVTVTRNILIKNSTTVKVKYHWSLFKSDKNVKEFKVENPVNFCFKIEPFQGFFNPDETITFQVTFKTSDPFPIFEYANLFIDDIPFQAIKNPPENLKKQLQSSPENEKIENQLNQPGFFGSNSTRPSFSYYEFELIGMSTYGKAEIDPPFIYFSQDLFINKTYKKNFTIKNTSNCQLNFIISQQQVTKNVQSSLSEYQGIIEPLQKKDIEIYFNSIHEGVNQKAEFKIQFDYADSLYVLVVGNFIGPKIKIHEPKINIGLLKSFSQAETFITVENTSEIEGECLFKLSNQCFPKMSFEDSKNLVERQFQEQQQNEQESYFDQTFKHPKFVISPWHIVLKPFEKKQIKVTCFSYHPVSHNSIVEMQVKNSDYQNLHLSAEIQDVHMALNTHLLTVDHILINKQFVFFPKKSENWIEIQNLGNIPSQFKWDIQPNEHCEIKFEPSEGVVQSKSNLPIKISITSRLQGDLNILFACDCFGLEYPLGFELQTQVYGLQIDYEIVESFVEPIKKLSALNVTRMPGQKITSTFLQKTLGNQRGIKTSENERQIKQVKKLERVDFYNCRVSQPKNETIILRNTSEIATSYSIYVENFQPYQQNPTEKSQKFNESIKSNNMTVNSNNTKHNKSSKSKAMSNTMRPATLLTAQIEQRHNFNSIDGQKLNEKKRLDRDQHYYLQNNKGLAIYCELDQGDLPPNSEVIVPLTLFNEICGSFSDTLCIDIKGLEVQKFPINIDIQGTAVIVSPNQIGIDYKGDYPTFHLGFHTTKCSVITREFRIQNIGPKDIEMEWKMFNLEQEDTKNQKEFFKIKIIPPLLGSSKIVQLEFEPIEPPQSTNGPFILQPLKEIIKGRKEKTFKINFESSEQKVFNSVIIAQPKLIENPEIKLGKLVLYVKAETIQPYLYYDKLLWQEGQTQLMKMQKEIEQPYLYYDKQLKEGIKQLIKMQKWALCPNNKEEKDFALVNNTKANLVCNIDLEGPFKLIASSTNSPMKYNLSTPVISLKEQILTSFVLVPSSVLELKIKFDAPSHKNLDQWPLIQKHIQNGNLNINFSNGDSQQIKLQGSLIRPFVELNTSGHQGIQGKEIQEFGVVHIYNKNTITIYLSNLNKIPAKWKISNVKQQVKKKSLEQKDKEQDQEFDDPSVFEFSISEAVLQGPSIPVKSLPNALLLPNTIVDQVNQRDKLLPQKILINFRPSKNVVYKSKFRILVEEGNSVDFCLRGTGTYEEHLEKRN